MKMVTFAFGSRLVAVGSDHFAKADRAHIGGLGCQAAIATMPPAGERVQGVHDLSVFAKRSRLTAMSHEPIVNVTMFTA